MIKFLLLFAVTLYSSRGFSNTLDNYYFKSVQLAGIFTSQAPGNSWSSLIRYNPYFQFKQDLKLGLSLALAPQVLSDKSRFIELEMLANVRYSFHQDWDGQFSIGPQYWSCEDCGIALASGLALYRRLNLEKASFLKDIFFQYLIVDQEKESHQFLIGTSIEF